MIYLVYQRLYGFFIWFLKFVSYIRSVLLKMSHKNVMFKCIDILNSKGKRTAVSYFVYILEIASTFCVVLLSIANKQIFVLCWYFTMQIMYERNKAMYFSKSTNLPITFCLTYVHEIHNSCCWSCIFWISQNQNLTMFKKKKKFL